MTERPIHASDLLAQLRRFGPPGADPAGLSRLADADRVFTSVAELRRVWPPSQVGISSGAYDALFAPLFGEFE